MSSPSKIKERKKQSTETKKRQLLNVFHQSITFLQIFTTEQLDCMEDKLHVFVFARGQLLAKENQPIDYIGVIAEGRAISKSKFYQIGDIIGHTQILGYTQNHPQSITSESDGVIIALRISDFSTLTTNTLANKITAHLAQLYTNQLLKREDITKQIAQFQALEEKKVEKMLTPEWSRFFNELDSKQKNKFSNYFPFYAVKQKDMVMSAYGKSYLLYLVQGQLIAKNKLQQTILEKGQIWNQEGFVLNQSAQQNVYCLSSDAVILLINKTLLENTFKSETFNAVLKIVLTDLTNKYKKVQPIQEDKEGKDTHSWTIFKKYPNQEILPLPKKSTNQKQPKQPTTSSTNQNSLMIFQTLFRDQLGANDGKLKTNTSAAQSNYQKLYTLKSQSQGKEIYHDGEVEKLRKEVEILSAKLKFNEEMSIGTKLDLIENKSKLAMNDVFKQIRKLHQQKEVIHSKIKNNEGPINDNLITFKQAFDKQIKENKLQELVAKCAFKWLYLTRKRKSTNKKL